jgi:RNA recognition motif-containing protein
MTNIADQKTVLDAPSHLIGGRKCFVKIPMSKNGDAAKDVRAAEDVRLFVGRLSDKISYKRLRDFFTEEAQKIDSNVSITDAFIPNPFRGFGFINLTSTAVAKELLKYA